jgi:hypothetical protein
MQAPPIPEQDLNALRERASKFLLVVEKIAAAMAVEEKAAGISQSFARSLDDEEQNSPVEVVRAGEGRGTGSHRRHGGTPSLPSSASRRAPTRTGSS